MALRIVIKCLALGFDITPVMQKRLSIFIAVISMLFFLLQSIGELSAADMVSGLLLAIVSFFYISYMSPRKNKDTRP